MQALSTLAAYPHQTVKAQPDKDNQGQYYGFRFSTHRFWSQVKKNRKNGMFDWSLTLRGRGEGDHKTKQGHRL